MRPAQHVQKKTSPDLPNLQEYVKEGRREIQKLAKKLTTITVNSLKEDLEDYYLIFHTLKGNARMIGQNDMQDLCHALGMLILDVKDFALRPNEEIVSILQDSHDILSHTITKLTPDQETLAKMTAFQERVIGASIPPEKKSFSQQQGRQAEYFQALGIDSSAGRAIDFQDASSRFFEITIVLEETVFLKKTRVYTIIRNFTMLDESVRFGKMTPSLEDLIEGRFGLEFTIILQSTKDSEQLKEIVKQSGEIADVKIRIIPTQELLASMKKESNTR
jgi:chemotaxis protein histidine kinase CheA